MRFAAMMLPAALMMALAGCDRKPAPPSPPGNAAGAVPATDGPMPATDGPTLGELAALDKAGRKQGAAAGAGAGAGAGTGAGTGAGAGTGPGSCGAAVHYGPIWAKRLPAAFPVYPGATIEDVAGNDAPGCALRIVSFVSDKPVDDVIGWYRARAVAAGYSAEVRAEGAERVLGGTDARTGGAYLVSALPAPGGGASADLIVSIGR
jgi:hypothetical protein